MNFQYDLALNYLGPEETARPLRQESEQVKKIVLRLGLDKQ